MGREEVINEQLGKIHDGQESVLRDALGAAFDANPGSGGGLSQADVDAAVKAQKDSDQAALDQAHADAQAALDAVNKQLSDLQAAKDQDDSKLASDESIIQGLKDGQQAIQDALDKLKALISG